MESCCTGLCVCEVLMCVWGVPPCRALSCSVHALGTGPENYHPRGGHVPVKHRESNKDRRQDECLFRVEGFFPRDSDPTQAHAQRKGPHQCGGALHGVYVAPRQAPYEVQRRGARQASAQGPHVHHHCCMHARGVTLRIFLYYGHYTHRHAVQRDLHPVFAGQTESPHRGTGAGTPTPLPPGMPPCLWQCPLARSAGACRTNTK